MIHEVVTNNRTCVSIDNGTLLGFLLFLLNAVEWVLLDVLLLHAPSKECLGAHEVIIKGRVSPVTSLTLLV